MTITDDAIKRAADALVEGGVAYARNDRYGFDGTFDDLSLTIPQRVKFCTFVIEATAAAVMKAVEEGVPPEQIEVEHTGHDGSAKKGVRSARSEWESAQKRLIAIHEEAKKLLALLTVDNGLSYVLTTMKKYVQDSVPSGNFEGYRLDLIEETLLERGLLDADDVERASSGYCG